MSLIHSRPGARCLRLGMAGAKHDTLMAPPCRLCCRPGSSSWPRRRQPRCQRPAAWMPSARHRQLPRQLQHLPARMPLLQMPLLQVSPLAVHTSNTTGHGWKAGRSQRDACLMWPAGVAGVAHALLCCAGGVAAAVCRVNAASVLPITGSTAAARGWPAPRSPPPLRSPPAEDVFGM